MSTSYHTAISARAAADAATFNAPLGQLDAAIATMTPQAWAPISITALGFEGDASGGDTAKAQAVLDYQTPVYVPSGTWLLTTGLVLRTGNDLFGSRAAVLKLKDSAGFTGGLVSAATGQSGIRVRGLTIDGNSANNAVVHPDGQSASLVHVGDCDDFVLEGCLLRDGIGRGVSVTDGQRARIAGNVFSNCRRTACSINATPGTVGHHEVTGNWFVNVSGSAFGSEGSDRNRFSGNKVLASTVHGLVVSVPAAVAGDVITVTATPGSFSLLRPGMVLIGTGSVVGGDTFGEMWIDAVAPGGATLTAYNYTGGAHGGFAVSGGPPDMAGCTDASENVFEGNHLEGGASLGLSVFCHAQGLGGAGQSFFNSLVNNTIRDMGASAINIQGNAANQVVSATQVIGNRVISANRNGDVNSVAARAGIAIQGFTTGTVVDQHVANDEGVAKTTYWLQTSTPSTGTVVGPSSVVSNMVDASGEGIDNAVDVTIEGAGGWGAGAAVSGLVVHGRSYTFTITTDGTADKGASASITVDHRVSSGGSPPQPVAWVTSGSGGVALLQTYSASTTQTVLVYPGTPGNAVTYVVTVHW